MNESTIGGLLFVAYVFVAAVTFDLTGDEARAATIWRYVGAAIWPLTWLGRGALSLMLPRPPSS